MKKHLLIAVLFAAISCTHKTQEVKLGFNVNTQMSNIGSGRTIDLAVFDDRTNRRYLGQKILGKNNIKVTADQNVAEFLKKKLTDNLILKGFGIGEQKIVEVHLKSLGFKAKRGFPIGYSKMKVMVKVVIKDTVSASVFSKDYALEIKNKYFIASLKFVDAQVINSLMQEMVQDILMDEELLNELAY